MLWFITQCIFVFLGYAFADWLWVLCVYAVTKKKALRAGILAIIIQGLYVFGVLSYTHNMWLAIPCLLGSFFGTYVSVLRSGKEEKDT